MTDSPMSENMELKEVAATLWRGKWLIVFLTLFAASSAYVTSRQMTPVYEASTTLLIDQAPASQTSDSSAIAASQRLAMTYAELLTKRPVIDETLARLGLDTSLENTGSNVRVRLVEDTQLIELSAQSIDPVLAAELANTIVGVFTEQNQALQAGRFAASKASLRAQLEAVGEQIQAHEAAIANLGAPRTSSLIAELERLQIELAQYQASYNNLLQSYEQIRTAEASSISNVIQVEPAEAPSQPIRPRVLLNTLLAGVVGALVAVGVVFLLQHLDDTIRTTEDVERILQVPVIGYIPKTGELSRKAEGAPVLGEAQYSATVEAFRSLRTNLELLGNPGSPSTVYVTSPGTEDGKTTVASNLAVIIGNGDKKVVLIDADFRRPSVHEVFGVPNELGLSDVLMDNLEPQAVATSFDNPRFKLITSGSRVDNPAELLLSTRFSDLLAELGEQFDIMIFDGPPFLATEALILASRLKSVMLVIQPGRTREGVARTIKRQLERARADLMGVVLNKAPKGDAYGSGGYYYYDDEDEKTSLEQTQRETTESFSDREITRPSPTDQTEPPPRRRPAVLEPYTERIDQLLKESEQQPSEQSYSARRIYQLIQAEGYPGSESTVRSYVRRRREAIRGRVASLPVEFDPVNLSDIPPQS